MTYVTIEGFEDLTQQQMFDMSARHVLSTGQKSMGKGGVCQYGGVGCAASPFLRPEKRELMDSDESGWDNLYDDKFVPSHQHDLVCAMQSAHDNSKDNDFIVNFKVAMRKVAAEFDLSDAVLDTPPPRPFEIG